MAVVANVALTVRFWEAWPDLSRLQQSFRCALHECRGWAAYRHSRLARRTPGRSPSCEISFPAACARNT